MTTFVNLSNTSQLICIIAKSPRIYKKSMQKLLFRVDCCCAEKVVSLRRSESSFSRNALPLYVFANFNCICNTSQAKRTETERAEEKPSATARPLRVQDAQHKPGVARTGSAQFDLISISRFSSRRRRREKTKANKDEEDEEEEG